MRNFILFIMLLNFSNLNCQNLDFVKNESLIIKLQNIVSFIEKSETIQTNYRSYEKNNIYIVSEINPFFEFVLLTSLNKNFKNSKIVKLNDYIFWILVDNCPKIIDCKIDDLIFDEKLLNQLDNCNDFIVTEKEEKNIKPMLNSVFEYEINNNNEYLLNGLSTFDALLFLSIEFKLN